MFKLITLLKRKPRMSRQAFIEHYESTHVKIADKYMNGRALRYVRRYLRPVTNPLTGESVEPDFDVLTEVWFVDRTAFEAAMVVFASPEVAREIAQDEENLFDRDKNRLFIEEEEHESQLEPI